MEWRPPGWGVDSGAARYVVASTDEGYQGHLEVCASLSEREVREFLTDWVERRGARPRTGSGAEAGGAFLSITLDTHGHCFEVTCFTYASQGAPQEWPRVSLAELMRFATLDLRGG